MTLAGKNAVVLGGGSGIGQAIARALADAGGNVAIGGRRLEALQETANNTSIQIQAVDIACRKSVGDFFSWFYQSHENLDILVNAAGVNIRDRSMAAMPPGGILNRQRSRTFCPEISREMPEPCFSSGKF